MLYNINNNKLHFNITLCGNIDVGYDVNHNLKSGFTSFLYYVSNNDSNSGINDDAK